MGFFCAKFCIIFVAFGRTLHISNTLAQRSFSLTDKTETGKYAFASSQKSIRINHFLKDLKASGLIVVRQIAFFAAGCSTLAGCSPVTVCLPVAIFLEASLIR